MSIPDGMLDGGIVSIFLILSLSTKCWMDIEGGRWTCLMSLMTPFYHLLAMDDIYRVCESWSGIGTLKDMLLPGGIATKQGGRVIAFLSTMPISP